MHYIRFMEYFISAQSALVTANSPEEAIEVARYMGLLEVLALMAEDGAPEDLNNTKEVM